MLIRGLRTDKAGGYAVRAGAIADVPTLWARDLIAVGAAEAIAIDQRVEQTNVDRAGPITNLPPGRVVVFKGE